MAIASSSTVGAELLKIWGLEKDFHATRIEILLEAGTPPSVNISFLLNSNQCDGIKQVLKKYVLSPEEDELNDAT